MWCERLSLTLDKPWTWTDSGQISDFLTCVPSPIARAWHTQDSFIAQPWLIHFSLMSDSLLFHGPLIFSPCDIHACPLWYLRTPLYLCNVETPDRLWTDIRYGQSLDKVWILLFVSHRPSPAHGQPKAYSQLKHSSCIACYLLIHCTSMIHLLSAPET